MGAESPWMPDHFMSFISQLVWKPGIKSDAKLVLSPDGFFDQMQIPSITASRIRGVNLGTAATGAYRRHPMALAQSSATLDASRTSAAARPAAAWATSGDSAA